MLILPNRHLKCNVILMKLDRHYWYSHITVIAGFVSEDLICANYARCHGLANFNSTVTFNSVSNSAIVLGMSQLCTLLYLMWSKCRYLVSRRPFTEQLRILAIVTTVQHFNRYSAIKLYRHMHPCEGVIIGS